MVLPNYKYKNGDRLKDRLSLAQEYVSLSGMHGSVTLLSKEYNIGGIVVRAV